MTGFSQSAIAQQIALICESDTFRSAPQLTSLLRSLEAGLWAPTVREAGIEPLSARGTGLPAGLDPSRNPRVRVQATRLRQALAAYYRGPGVHDPLIVELPRRSYRLRLTHRGRQSHVSHFRAVERATLLVADFAGLGLTGSSGWIPEAVLQLLLVDLGRFTGTAVVGPIPRAAVASGEGTLLAISQPYPESFVLDASVQADAEHMVLTARLIDGGLGGQIWSWSAPLRRTDQACLAAWAETVAALARQLADETGVIAHEILRTSAGKPVDELTVHEAIAALWRFWITGLAADREYAHTALANVVQAVPHSGVALAYLAASRCESFFASQTGALTLSDDVLDLFERARSLAPGHPWVELLRCYGLLFARKTAGIDAVIASLELLPASGSFLGMLGGLVLAMGDLEKARQLLARGLVEAAQQPYWCRVSLAVIDLALDDLAEAARWLEGIPSRVDPLVQILRAAVACRCGSPGDAREFVEEAIDLCEGLPRHGEIMLRRVFPDRVVDAVATSLQPLGLGWFHDPPARQPA